MLSNYNRRLLFSVVSSAAVLALAFGCDRSKPEADTTVPPPQSVSAPAGPDGVPAGEKAAPFVRATTTQAAPVDARVKSATPLSEPDATIDGVGDKTKLPTMSGK